MDEDPARRAPQEGLDARARRRGRPRRPGVGDDLGRQHRRHDGLGAAAHGPDQGRQPPGDRHPDPGPGSTPTVLLDAGANADGPARVARPVRPDGLGLRPPPLRHRPSRRSACCRSARSPARATRCARRPSSCSRPAPGIDFIGNVEGRDIMTDGVDVVVTDGFTGNVVLKALEGGVRTIIEALLEAMTPRATRSTPTP